MAADILRKWSCENHLDSVINLLQNHLEHLFKMQALSVNVLQESAFNKYPIKVLVIAFRRTGTKKLFPMSILHVTT